MRMGRRRKDNPLGLDPVKHARLTFKHGAFYYVHRETNRWENVGTDLKKAKLKAEHYNDPDGQFGTMAHWMDEFLIDCERRVGLPKERRGLARRTFEDYQENVGMLKPFFGRMFPQDVEPHHIGQYLDIGAAADRAVRANREKACLSAFFSWLIRQPNSPVRINPCKGVRRNPETPRERYVEDEEFRKVDAIAETSVSCLMHLIYRTLQRPEDIITWDSRNIVRKVENGVAKRIIRNVQGKTGAKVDIEITPEIDAILARLWGPTGMPFVGMPLIHTKAGKPYTYSGLCAMLQRYRKKAGVENFGFYDLKGKGATDMLMIEKVPIELIQVLCGHESVKTTEIYIKARWRGTVMPNQVQMAG